MSCFSKCILQDIFFSRHLLLGVFILFQMAVCPVETDKNVLEIMHLLMEGGGTWVNIC